MAEHGTSNEPVVADSMKSSRASAPTTTSASPSISLTSNGGKDDHVAASGNGRRDEDRDVSTNDADPQDLSIFVQDLLEQMQTRFSHMGDSIIGRIDDMGNRIDDLEKSVKELMERAGVEPQLPPSNENSSAPASFQTPPHSPHGRTTA